MSEELNRINLPLISIGLPTFNRPSELERSIIDLTSQTYKNIEIVISDNYSSDEKVQIICENYAKKDSRIRYFRQKRNIGTLQNFDFVLSASEGEFFMWSADDDRHAADFVESLYSALQRRPEAICAMCAFDYITESGEMISLGRGKELTFRLFESSVYFVRLISYLLREKGKASLIYGLFRMSAREDLRLAPSSLAYSGFGSDVMLCYRIVQAAPIAFVPRKLYQVTLFNTKHYMVTQKNDGNSIKGARWARLLYDNIILIKWYILLARPNWKALVTLLAPVKAVLLVSAAVFDVFLEIGRISRIFPRSNS